MKSMAQKDEEDVLELLKQHKALQAKIANMAAEKKQAAIDNLKNKISLLQADLELLDPSAVAKPNASGRTGRPKGYKMTEEQKAAMRAGRARAKAERESAGQK